ncbi:MAG: MBL fold metallo-hydrolase [Nanoarchaeota archaeon]|nr:MBL fold metallo-hydrolase [Nanoarchaeota archaeon]
MKVTKYGHCCLLIEEKGLRILTDPGGYSTAQNDVKDIDVILITHEHADHIHIPSLKDCIKNNPEARIITNRGVAKLLDPEGIKYEIVEDGEKIEINRVLIEAIEGKHEFIYNGWADVQNTGFFIGDRLFYPGDSFHNPRRLVDILALPVAGPWCKISDAVKYAIKVKPRIAFPVHDGALKIMGGNHKVPEKELPKHNIQFVILEDGKETEL